MPTILDQENSVVWEIPNDQEIIHVEVLPPLKPKPAFSFCKRFFDVAVSILMMILLLVPMAVIAIVIVLDSPGKPIYAQTRLGLNQKPFQILKFRSMVDNAEEGGLRWAEHHDDRVTKVGAFLRNTRLDELPQLWNILRGEMSFVGPRPERPEFYDIFDTYIIGFRQRMLVKPGLTGLAQVNGGYDLKPEEKIIYDLEYVRNCSLRCDLHCLYKTINVVIFREGAH